MTARGSIRTRLVSIYGASTTLSALCAVRLQTQLARTVDDERIVTVVHPPTPSVGMARATLEVVSRLVRSQGWPEPVLLTQADVDEIVQGDKEPSYPRVLARLRERIGVPTADEVMYAHDIVGRVPELMLNAYPRAERILYGDGLGLVFDRDYYMALQKGASYEDALRASHEKRRPPLRERLLQSIGRTPAWRQPTSANLVLPVDATGSGLQAVRLEIPPREMVLDVLSTCHSALPELSAYAHDVLASTSAPHYLMLLENFTDAGYTLYESEIGLYEAAVRRYMPAGSTVLIKEHPLTTQSTAVALAERLGDKYTIRLVPEHLGRFPIELWSELVESCNIVSMMSYSGISLAFLYGKETLSALDPDFIRRFLLEHTWPEMERAAHHHQGQLERLAHWDGRGVLWAPPEAQDAATR